MSSLGNPSSNGRPSTYGCRTDVDGRPLEDGLPRLGHEDGHFS